MVLEYTCAKVSNSRSLVATTSSWLAAKHCKASMWLRQLSPKELPRTTAVGCTLHGRTAGPEHQLQWVAASGGWWCGKQQ